MKIHGNIELQQNLLKEAVLPLDAYFPVNPVVGQLVFNNRILYICVELLDGNLPVWAPLTQTITSYTHYQTTSSASWIINHTLNTSEVQVTVYDTLNRVVIPSEVQINSASQVEVTLGTAAQGSVVILSGVTQGNQAPVYAYEHYQTTPSTTWVITHGLGTHPIVRVFIGNQEVQPETITFDSVNQVTITFLTPQVGQAKLI